VSHQALSYWISAAGWLLLASAGGLSDSIFWFVKNHGDPQCYQMPTLTLLGCVSSAFAWEIAFALTWFSAILIAAGARLSKA
jgi:hypothetical protein